MTTQPLRVVGYARLSRASDDSTSIAKQREILTDVARSRGWTLVGFVADPDLSATATRLDRPGLTEVRTKIASGEADAVLVWRLDRIARSVVDFSTLVEEGVQIISASEPIDTTTPQGKAFAQILQVFAELEAKTTGERIKATHTYLRGRRRWTGGPRPYGYQPAPAPDDQGSILVPVAEEAEVVERVASGILAGRTTYSLAAELNAEGVPTTNGARWTPANLRRTIRSDVLLGRIVRDGHPVLDDAGAPVVAWEPLLDLATAEEVRRRTEGGKTPENQRKRASRLLSGVVLCGSCEHPMVGRIASGHQVYGCVSNTRGRECDHPVTVRAELVEAEVEARFLAMVGPFEVVEERITSAPVAGLADCDAAIAETAREMTRPGADLPALLTRMQSLHSRRAELEALPSMPTVERVETGRTFAEAWQTAGLDTRRGLLLDAGAVVTVAPARRRGYWDPTRVEFALEPAS